MKNRRQIIKNIIIFIILIIITFVIIFNNHDLKKTIDIILNVKLNYVLLAILAMLLDFLLESLNIKNILKVLGNEVSILKTLKYTIIGFFFSGITPAASGGQPMEIYYMKKDGIPITHSTLALLVEVCSFHIVTITCGIIGAIINHKLLSDGFIWVFIIGASLNFIALTSMMIGLFSSKLSQKLVDLFLNILKNFHYFNIEEKKESIIESLREYHQGSEFIKKHKNIFLKSIITVFFQVMMYYLIPFLIYKSFGLNNYNAIEIISIQAMLFISVSSIPLPGSVGISESAFLRIYLTVFGSELLASAMLLNRTINFYLFIIVGLLVTIFNTLKIKKYNLK